MLHVKEKATLNATPNGSENVERLLQAPALFKQQAYINGAWTDGEDTLDVTNPADGSLLGTIPDLGPKETHVAIDAAERAFPEWSSMLAKDRAVILRRWADLMRAHSNDLALIMTLEQGKPLSESEGEIEYAASFFEWFGEEGKRAYGDTIPSHLHGSQMTVYKNPVGVTAAITPWNFPSAMITRKAGAALAAGCTMVVRPASETPFSALALAVLAEEAGVPEGVFSVITGRAAPISKTLCDSETVRKISFTGSTEIGRLLLEQSAQNVKKLSMELGGHAPFIAFADCHVDKAVEGAIGAKFATTGQDCLAANRIYVHEDIYDEFARKYADATKAMKLGNGLEDGVELGPLMNEAAVQKCEEHVNDALVNGASLLCGGERAYNKGELFYQATVLGDVTTDMKIAKEETFGPVAPLIKFSDEEAVIKSANDTIYGLAAYVYSENIRRCHRVARALEYGMVGVNTPKFTGASIPFGGVKQSGLGREGGHQGLDDYMETQYICLGGLNEQ
ncbi:MAG: NAD-dependent succinate-semialdehyde dehydrogenase [Alphaproteobacteria bacterium]|nr:NAD-dependent succinate-semialdehyde dehydrogenase [Alphaproteobacteria bacterium]